MTTYLAGPMRGLPLYNFPLFEMAAEALRSWGHVVVSPAEIDIADGLVRVERDEDGKLTVVELTPKFSIEAALRRDYRAITEALQMVMLPGWEESSGVAGERRVAIECGIPVFELTLKVAPRGPYPWLLRVPDNYCPPLRLVDTPPVAAHTSTHANGVNGLGEVRVVDPVTGGAKGQKDARFDLLPYDALWAVAEHFGRGAKKYESRNWERGVAWSLNAGAMQRHFAQWWQGEDIDAETGSSHLSAVAWHALVLLAFTLRGAGTDDRPSTVHG